MRYRLRTLMVLLAVGLPLLPISYVLSVGPAAWLVQNKHLSLETYNTLYWPLFALIGDNKEAGRWLNLYEEWWSAPR